MFLNYVLQIVALPVRIGLLLGRNRVLFSQIPAFDFVDDILVAHSQALRPLRPTLRVCWGEIETVGVVQRGVAVLVYRGEVEQRRELV